MHGTQRALVVPQTNRNVTFAIEHANPNSCPFYCRKIVISLVKGNVNMKTTSSLRICASRFFSNRYPNRERPDYLVELVAFGIILIAVALSLGSAAATH
jgi:hypothetical protein